MLSNSPAHCAGLAPAVPPLTHPPPPSNLPPSYKPGTALQLSLHANSTHSLAAPQSAAAHTRLALAHTNHYFSPPCTDAVMVSTAACTSQSPGSRGAKIAQCTIRSFPVQPLLHRPLIRATQGAQSKKAQNEAPVTYSKYKHVLCPAFRATCSKTTLILQT